MPRNEHDLLADCEVIRGDNDVFLLHEFDGARSTESFGQGDIGRNRLGTRVQGCGPAA
jgi:hypothetical protein